MHSFLQHFDTHSFQINFRVLHNLKGVFRTVSNIYDEAFSQKYFTVFSRCIFAEMLQGFDRVLHTALQPSFFIFFHFLRLDTWMNDMNILLLFRKCAVTFLTWRNWKYYKIIYWFPNHLPYIDHGNITFICYMTKIFFFAY